MTWVEGLKKPAVQIAEILKRGNIHEISAMTTLVGSDKGTLGSDDIHDLYTIVMAIRNVFEPIPTIRQHIEAKQIEEIEQSLKDIKIKTKQIKRKLKNLCQTKDPLQRTHYRP